MINWNRVILSNISLSEDVFSHMWFLKPYHIMHVFFTDTFLVQHVPNRAVTKLGCNEIFCYCLSFIKCHIIRNSRKSAQAIVITRCLDTRRIPSWKIAPQRITTQYNYHLQNCPPLENWDSTMLYPMKIILIQIYWCW